MTIEIGYNEDGYLEVPLGRVLFGPEAQGALKRFFTPERGDERIGAWGAIASHPFFKECYYSEDTLLAAMIAKLDGLMGDTVKPWDRARDGEYWELTLNSDYAALFKRTNGEWRHEGKARKPLDPFHSITDARRIYPTEEN